MLRLNKRGRRLGRKFWLILLSGLTIVIVQGCSLLQTQEMPPKPMAPQMEIIPLDKLDWKVGGYYCLSGDDLKKLNTYLFELEQGYQSMSPTD